MDNTINRTNPFSSAVAKRISVMMCVKEISIGWSRPVIEI